MGSKTAIVLLVLLVGLVIAAFVLPRVLRSEQLPGASESGADSGFSGFDPAESDLAGSLAGALAFLREDVAPSDILDGAAVVSQMRVPARGVAGPIRIRSSPKQDVRTLRIRLIEGSAIEVVVTHLGERGYEESFTLRSGSDRAAGRSGPTPDVAAGSGSSGDDVVRVNIYAAGATIALRNATADAPAAVAFNDGEDAG